jgi:uncharacterized membrane protein YdjX (TVP38/TMEM64 family)
MAVWPKRIVAATIICGILAYILWGPDMNASIRTLREFEAMGARGYLYFGLAYIVVALLLLPASLLTIGAGAIFGALEGVVLVSLSSTLAACVAFATSRWLLRDTLTPWIKRTPIFHALDRAIELEGFRAVLLIRTSPIFPYNFTNYVLGATRLPSREFALGSWIGMLPGTIVYVWIGSAATSIGQALSSDAAASKPKLALFVVGTIATILTVTLIGKRAKKELEGILSKEAPLDYH